MALRRDVVTKDTITIPPEQNKLLQESLLKNTQPTVRPVIQPQPGIQRGSIVASSEENDQMTENLRYKNMLERQRQMAQESREKKLSRGEKKEPYKSKLGLPQALAMVLVALFLFDVPQIVIGLASVGVITAILVFIVNNIINLLAWLVFAMWFGINGMNIFGRRRAATVILSFAADILSLGILPGWTVIIVITYLTEKALERGGVIGDLTKAATGSKK